MTNNSRWKGETVAGVGLDNNTECTKPERNNRGEKYADRLEMSVQMGTTLSRFTGITLGCVVYQKTSGLPIVGDR